MARFRSANAGLAAAGAALLAAAVVVAVPAGAATAGCSVDYAVSSQWSGGFGANVSHHEPGRSIDQLGVDVVVRRRADGDAGVERIVDAGWFGGDREERV